MKRIMFLLLLGLFLNAALVSAQNFQLQHFRCYPVLKVDPDVKGTVDLQDQFNFPPLPFERVDFLRANRFCNPVAKFHPGIPNPFFPITDDRQHLTFYATFPQQAPLRVASIENQFGPQRLLLREPVALAVPTQKLAPMQHDFPERLDHFRCYASWGLPVNQGVALRDQFMTNFGSHFVLNPVVFCNPTRKVPIEPPGEEVGILNPDAHLACYSMTRVRFEGELTMTNQFDDQRLAVGSPNMLCVPTRKVAWFPIEDATTDPGDASRLGK